ncbi:MAG TPA: beta-propeller fold lactonase family protein, partial [Tepidisphaeraceae bacterium]|nr:beta-propeller fold lactonase family protein [Tepidisphaeraceae bacterium]
MPSVPFSRLTNPNPTLALRHPFPPNRGVSNRGRYSLALFTIDPEKGALTYIDEQLSGGKTPRHFSLDPTGNFLLIGNQGTNQMPLCRIDQSTGRLKPSGPLIDVPSPVCMIFVPPTRFKAAARVTA